jgi:hypothetical protein
VWEAFKDYVIDGLALSKQETDLLRLIFSGDNDAATALAVEVGFARRSGTDVHATREGQEVMAKLAKLGIPLSWPGALG